MTRDPPVARETRTGHESEIPAAFREVLGSGVAVDGGGAEPLSLLTNCELFAELGLLLEAAPPGAGLAERLAHSVSARPLSYAPFFSRLARLFDLDQAELEHDMERLAEPRNWKRTGLRGVRRIEVVPGPRLADASTSFVQFAPGAHFPRHRHLGFEQVFVLEGSYTDDRGDVYAPGCLHEMHAGTAHEFWIDEREPCIAASIQTGLRFQSWPAAIFNPFMKR